MSQMTWYPRLVPSATQFSNGSTAIDRTRPLEERKKEGIRIKREEQQVQNIREEKEKAEKRRHDIKKENKFLE